MIFLIDRKKFDARGPEVFVILDLICNFLLKILTLGQQYFRLKNAGDEICNRAVSANSTTAKQVDRVS